MNNLRLGTKIGLGFGVLILLTLAIGLMAVWKMRAIHDKAIVLAQEYAPEVDVANNLERHALHSIYNIRLYTLTGDKAYLQNGEKALAETERYLKDALELGQKGSSLFKLREGTAALSQKVNEYESLADKTISLRESIDTGRASMDEAARAFTTSCQTYLAGQNRAMDEAIGAGSPGSTGNGRLRELHRKITLINEVTDLGDSIRVDNFKGQTLRSTRIIQDGLIRFADMFRLLDDLGETTPHEAQRREIIAIKEAAKQYKAAMDSWLGDWLALQDVLDKRKDAAGTIFEISQAAALSGIGHTRAIARETEDTLSAASAVLLGGLIAASLLGLGVAFVTARGITRPLKTIVGAMGEIAEGDFRREIDFRSGDEVGLLADAFRKIQTSLRDKTSQTEAIAAGDYSREAAVASWRDTLGQAISRMTSALRQAKLESERTDWIKTGLNGLAAKVSGETDPRALADKVLAFLTPYLNAQGAALYLMTEDRKLSLQSSYASRRDGRPEDALAPGDGLALQAAEEKTIVTIAGIPDDSLRASSFFGEVAPRNILALPCEYQDNLVCVLEFAAFEEFTGQSLDFLRLAAEPLAVAFDSIGKQARVRELLGRTQAQARQLLEQQEELRASNEELEEHTQSLRQSEEELKQQQEELQTLNEELEEKNGYLEQQKSLVTRKNVDLEQARQDVERKAAELEVTSRYKSEFLANMSHELRTPLNSLLLLARKLRDNTAGHLDPAEAEAAGIIYKSGNDLLSLINDILDLSKVEAGKMTVNLETVRLDDLARSVETDFGPLAGQKRLTLKTEVEEGLPAAILTDPQRLGQIMRNLVSNGVKFTERGEVVVHIHRPGQGVRLHSGLDPARAVAFSVTDTGIGIPADKHRQVFEAFQQVDGSTSRKYGGTGLGLSITRELARLLGGEIGLKSEPEVGSTFTLYLPVSGPAPATGQTAPEAPPLATRPASIAASPAPRAPWAPGAPVPPPALTPPGIVSIPDDRQDIVEGDRTVLVIEDDPSFAAILAGLCRDKGFKVLAAATGEDGLALAEEHLPTAVILDIRLPGMSGLTALSALKGSHATRHIPVHIISVHDTPHDALIRGAMGFLTKPVEREELDAAIEKIEAVVDKKVKDLLLVEDNADLRRSIQVLIGDLGVNVTEVETGGQALEAIRSRRFDCMILDLGLADMSGFELLKLLESEHGTAIPPVIVYTGKDLTKDEERELRMHAESIIVKGARSDERLLDEVTLFLHHMVSTLPRSKQRMLVDLHKRDAMLEGKKILLVDDDMRNLFALSMILQEKGLDVLKAEDGPKGLELLESEQDVDLVLLDIMMPGMDGFEVMRRIRSKPRFARLPVIALTAKAMKEDREKCLAAGASDYLSKPVDEDKLLSMLRVWLYGK